jgi:hypothetical protein
MRSAVYPFLTGPLIAGGSGFLRLIRQFSPIGVAFMSVDVARDYGVPVLVAVPGALLVLCTLGVRWIAGSVSSTVGPFDSSDAQPFATSSMDPLLDWPSGPPLHSEGDSSRVEEAFPRSEEASSGSDGARSESVAR